MYSAAYTRSRQTWRHGLREVLDMEAAFNEEPAFNIISNNYHDHSSSVNYQFNPIEKIVELYQQEIHLYERMLKEKNKLIDKLMKERK